MFPLKVIDGGSLSTTVTVCVQLDRLPELSVAVQVIVVVPAEYVGSATGFPSLRLPVTVGLPQLSVAVAVPVTTSAEQVPGKVLVVMLAGQVIFGGSVSFTVIVCVQDELLPEPSVAVQVIVVAPFG